MLASHSSPVWLRLSKNGNLMATKKQTAANRRNAKRSTGPKTPGGKAASSMNALRHGLRARTVVLPGESREEFDRIHGALEDQYRPQNPRERHLVDQAAIAQWKLARAEAFEAASYEEEPSAKAHAAILDRMTQVTSRLERAYFKAYKELERIQAARQKQPEPSKGKKGKDDQPPNLRVRWLQGDGQSEVLYERVNGVAVKPDANDKPPAEPSS